MPDYARVIVDITAAEVDKIFDYRIPGDLKQQIALGQAVKVPFGYREVNGFVVGFTDSPGVEADKIKQIGAIIKKESFFDRDLLSLFEWMARYYHSYLIKVLKLAVPAGVIRGKVKKRKKKYYRLSCSSREAEKVVERLSSSAPKQAQVLEFLLSSDRDSFTASELAGKAKISRSTIYKVRDKGLITARDRIVIRKPKYEKKEKETNIELTAAQKQAVTEITEAIKKKRNRVFLLHGVTGSGKTEVYMRSIGRALGAGKGAIVLVPEIALTPVMVRRFYSRFGEEIAVMHSHLSAGERYDEWRRIKQGKARIVIGARSAVFAPIQNPGLIIIDEEHENSYKQGEYPYYHARQVAVKRSRQEDFPVVLGSATPSLESYYYAREKDYQYLSLPERIHNEELPPVQIVDMRRELKEGNPSIFSRKLQNEVERALGREEQVLLFLNRRGYASFILCRDCGYTIKCRDCDISLTYHAGKNRLICHYCGYTRSVPSTCPECGSKYIKDFGLGTERIEEEIKKLFPEAAVDRMDVDTTGRKNSHQKILKRVETGETDILVGTQMIAKGHDYPNIAVVGVISADTILNLPDFRSAERTFQLLTQVAGRTGRGKKQGKVIIQTYNPESYSIKAAKDHDYGKFYRQEIKLRKNLDYPPFVRLVNIIISGSSENRVQERALKLGKTLRYMKKLILRIYGPSPAPISFLRKKHRWQIILKFTDEKKRYRVITRLQQEISTETDRGVRINIEVDPLSML